MRPRVEPMILVDQAAKKGGDCGQNIRLVYTHVESGWEGRDEPTAPQLWGQVLGGAAQAIDDIIKGVDEGRIAQCPAVVFGDESKAFERVSLMWLRSWLLSYPGWSGRLGNAD